MPTLPRRTRCCSRWLPLPPHPTRRLQPRRRPREMRTTGPPSSARPIPSSTSSASTTPRTRTMKSTPTPKPRPLPRLPRRTARIRRASAGASRCCWWRRRAASASTAAHACGAPRAGAARCCCWPCWPARRSTGAAPTSARCRPCMRRAITPARRERPTAISRAIPTTPRCRRSAPKRCCAPMCPAGSRSSRPATSAAPMPRSHRCGSSARITPTPGRWWPNSNGSAGSNAMPRSAAPMRRSASTPTRRRSASCWRTGTRTPSRTSARWAASPPTCRHSVISMPMRSATCAGCRTMRRSTSRRSRGSTPASPPNSAATAPKRCSR
ncbi:hypothetical protein D3C72_1181360 [compost metagenome]